MRRSGFRHPSVVVGEPAQDRGFIGEGAGVSIHPTATLEAFVQVDGGTQRATTIGTNVWLMKGVHVGHDAIIEEGCELPPGCVISGFAILGVGVRCGIGVLVKPYVVVGAGARLGMGAVVLRDVPAGEVWAGNPARLLARGKSEQTGQSA